MESLNIGRVGDLLLQFSGSGSEVGRWGALKARVIAEDPAWRLLVDEARSSWVGYPFCAYYFNDWRVWVLGEFYGVHGDKDSQGAWVESLVLGAVDWAKLNGHVTVIGWNCSQRQWHIWTNRFGTIHLFHSSAPQGTLLGTSFHSVSASHSLSDLDWTALSSFFGCGFFPDDRTYFGDVRILKPATETVIDAHGSLVSSTRYWNWNFCPNLDRSMSDTVDEFGHLFLQVMKELTSSGRVAIPISGGLDSRSTLAALTGGGGAGSSTSQIWSYSYGYSDDSVETQISQELAAVRKLPFQRYTIFPYLDSRIPLIQGSVEGFQDMLQCRQACVLDELGSHSEFVIAAHWGDVWNDDMGLLGAGGAETISDCAVVEHTFGKMSKKGRRWLWENVRGGAPAGLDPEKAARQFVEIGLEGVKSIEDPDFRVKAFKTDHWSFRWTLSSIRMFQAATFPRLPFYDTRIADFFLTVPTQQVSGRAIQLEFLRRFSPDLAKVRWQETGRNLFQGDGSSVERLLKRGINRLERMVLGKQVLERNWEVQLGGEQGKRTIHEWLLRDGLTLHNFVTKEALAGLVNEFRTAPLVDGRGYTISMLLSFSAWMEVRLNRGGIGLLTNPS